MKKLHKILSIIGALLIVEASFAATSTGTITNTSTIANTGTTTSTTIDSKVTSSKLSAAPVLVSKTSNSIKLEWDKIDSAAAYIVKYSKSSVSEAPKDSNAQYENESDQVTQTGTEIKDLEANTTYYLAIVTIDKEGNESDVCSDELVVKTDVESATTSTSTGSSLSVVKVDVIDNQTLSVLFNNVLSDDPIQVKITKTSDNSDIPVLSATKDSTSKDTVIVKTSSIFDKLGIYILTAISVKDEKGNNIKEGVNGIKEFTVPESIAESSNALNAAPTTMSGAANDATTMSGVTTTELTKPATGTKENLLIITALLLSFLGIYGFRKRFVK
ncbi:fibronectin type III domain-containing protein [Candidatus Gracilibacteria bacterium]|nr:fibronectin type III domain-containing protein [Candidatus Gracilibacteria bacterium]